MFCTKCGYDMPDGTMFCPSCGQKVEAAAPATPVTPVAPVTPATPVTPVAPVTPIAPAQTAANYSGDGFIYKLFESGKAERYAVLVTFLPILQVILAAIFKAAISSMAEKYLTSYAENFVSSLFGSGSSSSTSSFGLQFVCVISTLLMLIFLVAITAGATAVFVIACSRNLSNVWTWMAPIGVILAMLSSIFCLKYNIIAGLVFAILSLVCAVEFLARITIARQPIDSAISISADLGVYKSVFGK